MPDGPEVAEPRWLRVVVVGAALALASFGGVGLVLADLGYFRLWLVVLLGVPALLTLFGLVNPVLRVGGEVADRDTTTLERICARVALAIAALNVLWHGLNASQHAQINRDGGLYLNAGKWISSHGTLNLEPLVGPFAHNDAVVVTSTHMQLRGSHLEFDLSHMLPALLAEAHSVGGNRFMFLLVPFVSGFALLAFYLLASRLIQHPVAALGAMVTLSLLMPQVSFSRDSTTEIPLQLMLFTAVWLLCDPRTARAPGSAFTVGVLLGLAPAMHLESLVFLLGLPLVLTLLWLHTRRLDRPEMKRGIRSALGGVGVGLFITAFDLVRWNRAYLSRVDNDLVRLAVLAMLALLVAFVTVRIVRRPRVFARVQQLRPNGAIVAGILVAVAGFAAWLVRPSAEKSRGGRSDVVAYVQRIEHLGLDPTRRYAELSLRWVSWYVGPLTLTVAIVAAALLAVALVRGGARLPVKVATLMFTPGVLLFLWRPTIAPDQIYAARRFLPGVFPAVILLVFGALYLFTRGTGSTYASQRFSIAIVVGAIVVATPFVPIHHVSRMSEQRGMFSAITRTCDTLPDDSAVVMIPEITSTAYLNVPQTLRGFCNVPVAVMKAPVRYRALYHLAIDWKAQGKQLWVVTEFAQTIRQSLPLARVHSAPRKRDPHMLEQTLTRRPSHYRPDSFQLSTAAVPLPVTRPPS
jgi:hypothetical protein